MFRQAVISFVLVVTLTVQSFAQALVSEEKLDRAMCTLNHMAATLKHHPAYFFAGKGAIFEIGSLYAWLKLNHVEKSLGAPLNYDGFLKSLVKDEDAFAWMFYKGETRPIFTKMLIEATYNASNRQILNVLSSIPDIQERAQELRELLPEVAAFNNEFHAQIVKNYHQAKQGLNEERDLNEISWEELSKKYPNYDRALQLTKELDYWVENNPQARAEIESAIRMTLGNNSLTSIKNKTQVLVENEVKYYENLAVTESRVVTLRTTGYTLGGFGLAVILFGVVYDALSNDLPFSATQPGSQMDLHDVRVDLSTNPTLEDEIESQASEFGCLNLQ